MGNTKDFILKNAIEVGKDTKVTLGTITSGTVDLSTGNYFAETPAADTTYVFSNPGDVQSFQLEVTGGAVPDFASGSLLNTLNVNAQETEGSALFFKPDGTKMYYGGQTNDNIYEYNLSTPWDLSTATDASSPFSISAVEPSITSMSFKPDGTKLIVVGSGNTAVKQWNVSTAWDVSTATSASQSGFVLQGSFTYGLYVKPDGTKLYSVAQTQDTVYQYSMSTAWDVTTLSYDSVSFSVQTQAGEPRGIWFKSDGTKMYVFDNGFSRVHRYSLSTAWDISTASYDNVYMTANTEIGQIYIKGDEEGLYAIRRNQSNIYQYSTTTDATLTWPASVEWAGGSTPAAPANGETDLFTFVTDDAGTTYIGLQTADNLS